MAAVKSARSCFHIPFKADDGLLPCRIHSFVVFKESVHVAMVGHGAGIFCTGHHVRDLCHSVLQAVVGMPVQVREADNAGCSVIQP